MPRNKTRLYVALYARGGQVRMSDREDKYHWALLVGPKNEEQNRYGVRYHAKNVLGQMTWMFEEKDTSMRATSMILVRVLIGKVNDSHALRAKLREIPVVDNNPDWNCVTWVRDALAALATDGDIMGSAKLDWETVKTEAMEYCELKSSRGRFGPGAGFDPSKVPTLDLLEGIETIR